MRALIVAARFPLPVRTGGHTRLVNLVRQMGRHHDLFMLALASPDQERFEGRLEGLAVPAETVVHHTGGTVVQRLSAMARPTCWLATAGRACDRLAGRPRLAAQANVPRFRRLLRRTLRYDSFEIIHLDSVAVGRYLPVLRQMAPQAKIVLDAHDMDGLTLERHGGGDSNVQRRRRSGESERLRTFERGLWRNCDAVITVTEAHGRFVAAHGPSPSVWVVPNGVDTRVFNFMPRPAHALNLMFLGCFCHEENVAGLTFFCEHVWPLVRQRFPQVGLDVVGSHPPESVLFYDGQHGIRIHGHVPDVRQIMDGCLAMVVPIFSGGRVRLRVLEAFAGGLPVIATRAACEGIDVREGHHVLFAETPETFVDAIQCVVDFPDNAARIAREARRLVEQRYEWTMVAQRLNAVWQRLGQVTAGQPGQLQEA